MDLKNINLKIKWRRMISRGRNHALLFIDAVGVGNLQNYTKKIYDLEYRVIYYRQLDGSRWISERDYKSLIKIFEKKIEKNPAFLYEAGKKVEKTGMSIIKAVNQYKNTNWKELSNRDLTEILGKLYDLQSQLWGGPWFYGWYFFFNDIYLENLRNLLVKKLKGDFDVVWKYTITPEKMTFIGQEKLELLKLAKEFIKKGDKLLKNKIERHLQKFAFVNKYYFWGEGFTLEDIMARVKEMDSKGESCFVKEIASFKRYIVNLNKYPLSEKEKIIIKGFRKMAYASNFADEATNYYTFHLKPLFGEIARRLEISYGEFVSMRFKEIKESLQKNFLVVSRQELKARYRDHALIFAKQKVYVFSGENLKKYRKVELEEKKHKKIREFKGVVAFKGGAVQGKVRIIESNEKVKFFKEREILVTQMTNPTYLPAMQKSSAIITDEGGLLCHAAIISRELKIPCIIGTKIATQVLKDGDWVGVDAEKGIVKIIKRK